MAMRSPKLKLAPAARAELQRLIASIRDFTPIVTVVWSEDGSYTGLDGRSGALLSGWVVGFHDARKVPAELVQEIEGIAFVLDGARSPELDGRTLGFDGGKFRLNDIAI